MQAVSQDFSSFLEVTEITCRCPSAEPIGVARRNDASAQFP
jgi:hypothetical protein